MKAAETEYEKTIFYAKKQKEAGIITEEQYKELEAAAKAHKEEQKGTADDTYYGVLNSVKKNLGETSKYINIETGEIKKELAGMGRGYRQESQGDVGKYKDGCF